MTIKKKIPSNKAQRDKTSKEKENNQGHKIKEKNREQLLAEFGLMPTCGNALAAQAFLKSSVGDPGFIETHAAISKSVKKVVAGETKIVEATLIAQAITLDKVFVDLIRRAAANIGQHERAMETYMKLALKAQSQCRTTLQTLAEIKNPRPVAFVKQANIAHGHQQVNNGNITSRAENFEKHSNELLEANHGERLDPRTTGATSSLDTNLETMETVDGTAKR